MTNPINTLTMLSVPITTARTGASPSLSMTHKQPG
jgi:hypothetical protein